MYRWIACFLFVGVGACGLAGCGSSPISQPVVLTGPTMGTTYTVKIAGASVSPEKQAALQARIDEALARLNRQMSTYDPESEISHFNDYQNTDPFPVSPETAHVVHAALQLYEQSGGCFDVTVGPLVELWGFGAKGRRTSPPSDEEIQNVLAFVGSDKLVVELQPPALSKKVPQLRVDLSAIAKGYGVDLISEILREEKFDNHMVEIGGEVVCRGSSTGGDGWRIGVERPSADVNGRTIEQVVRLHDRAMATSGNYRNYFDDQGRRYAHTIDPKTGHPVEHSLASVTVIAPDCMWADAVATAVMVMGPDRGAEWLQARQDIEAMLLVAQPTGSFSHSITPGMKAYLLPGR